MASYRPCKCGCGQLLEKDDPRWYFNDACRKRAYRKRHVISRQKKEQKKRRTLCAFCGQEYTPHQHNQRCCSKAHKQALYRELKKLVNHDYIV